MYVINLVLPFGRNKDNNNNNNNNSHGQRFIASEHVVRLLPSDTLPVNITRTCLFTCKTMSTVVEAVLITRTMTLGITISREVYNMENSIPVITRECGTVMF